jgi:hypothetical protein
MSLTDPTQGDARLEEFFEQQLVPIAEKLRENDIQLLALEFSDNESSWYVPYVDEGPEVFSFDVDQLEQELRDLWRDQQDAVLLELKKSLADLARDLHRESDDDDDVSPFVYVMF